MKYFGKRKIEYIGRDSGPTDWSTCLLKSINTGFATIAQRMTNEELIEMRDRFGIGKPTGVARSWHAARVAGYSFGSTWFIDATN